MKIKINPKDLPKQRNAVAVSAWNMSGGGSHDKPYKAKRAKDKVALKKQDW
jgi:hypothetical protein